MVKAPACKHLEMRIPSPIMHSQKIERQNRQKIVFWHCLATAGFDKQQHFDGKSDGDFPRENRLSFADQLDEKLVHNRVGVTGKDEQYQATSGNDGQAKLLATGPSAKFCNLTVVLPALV